MTITTKTQQPKSIETLLSYLKPGETVYTAHQGANGTFLKLYAIRSHHSTGEPYIANITWDAAYAIGVKPKDRQGEWVIHNPVYGMDRGFDIVYRLSRTLFSDDPETYGDSGYALSHRWL